LQSSPWGEGKASLPDWSPIANRLVFEAEGREIVHPNG